MAGLAEILAKVLQRLPAPVHRLPEEWRRITLRETIRHQFTQTSSEWEPEEKVFGIGLSKTGTMSLAHALSHLGYKSFHFSRNDKVLGWPEFFDADAATDTPCAAQFEALYHSFEQSKFIYTVRDLDDWARSTKAHFGVDTPSEVRSFPTKESYWNRNRSWGWYNQVRRIQIRESLYARHDTWKEAYRTHDNRVRRFFEDKPNHRFLEMDITDGDGWGVLCPFLELDAPATPFPHRNKSE